MTSIADIAGWVSVEKLIRGESYIGTLTVADKEYFLNLVKEQIEKGHLTLRTFEMLKKRMEVA